MYSLLDVGDKAHLLQHPPPKQGQDFAGENAVSRNVQTSLVDHDMTHELIHELSRHQVYGVRYP